MAGFFLDSSALVKRYVVEDGTDYVFELMNGSSPLAVSRLTQVEVTCGIERRIRSGGVPRDQADAVVEALEADFRERFEVIELGASAMTRAIDLGRGYALRAADAIQLACALLAAGDRKTEGGFTLVSADQELNAAAESEGLTVLNPSVPDESAP